MKVVLLLLAAVMMAECAPSLKERLLSMKRQRGNKKVDGDAKLMEEQWPFAWIELVQLVGRCETGRNFLEVAEIDPADAEGFLVTACPHVMKGAEEIAKYAKDYLYEVTLELRKAFPLLQCSNLEAEREALGFWTAVNEGDNSEFETEAKPLFELCEEIFLSVANEESELQKDLEQVEETVSNRSVVKTLRELVNYAKRR